MCMGSAPKVDSPPALPPAPEVASEDVQTEVSDEVKATREKDKRLRQSTQEQLVKTSASGLLAPAVTKALQLSGATLNSG